MRRRVSDVVMLTAAFLRAACVYWLSVFPGIRRRMRYWRKRAQEIPDPVLRGLAEEAQRTKRGNIEGAAAFAAFAPRVRRLAVAEAKIAFQAIYDYADSLAEQATADPVAHARALHTALIDAIDPDARARDYYACGPRRLDGGYLYELVTSCRGAVRALPAYATVTPAIRGCVSRIVAYQTLNLNEVQGGHRALARWAQRQTPAGMGLRWWETAASAGSSLGIFALLAAAARPGLRTADASAIERAYFPWVGALHSLLDSLVDREEDAAAGQRSLLDYYASADQAAARMQLLATRSALAVRELPRSHEHRMILAAMSSHYLNTPQAQLPDALALTRGVLQEMGALAAPTALVHGARRTVGSLLSGPATTPLR